MISYYITTRFITSNKDYNSYRNPHSVYQTYPRGSFDTLNVNYNKNDNLYYRE